MAKDKLEEEYRITGDLALTMVAHAERCIGPNGTVLKVPEGEATHELRKSYLGQLAITAMDILDMQNKAGK